MKEVEILGWSQPKLSGPSDFESVLKLVVPQLAQYFEDDLNRTRERLLSVQNGNRCLFQVFSDNYWMEAENAILFLRTYGFQAELHIPG